MDKVENGMPGASLRDLSWTKSRRSGPQGNCVEMAVLPAGEGVAVRNSRFPEGPVLVYKDGDFDFLLERPLADG